MTTERLTRVFVFLFIVLFFAYLFGPLLIMGVSAFNSSTFPRATPWECFTTEWFVKLGKDERLLEGLWHSIAIGFSVVCVSVPIGMAGAILLTQVNRKIRPVFYTIIISPILVPGVVLGISTLMASRPSYPPIACWSSSPGCSASTRPSRKPHSTWGRPTSRPFTRSCCPS
jgi:spermidine/putrescine transport system permease protein